MAIIIVMAIKDIFKTWKLALIMSLLFATTFASYVTILAFKHSFTSKYDQYSQNWLLVAKSDSVGEVHGSRLSPEIGEMLIDNGYENPIPEIHQAVGTSLATGMLMRGVSLKDYAQISIFTLITGEALDEEDGARLAMVGVNRADAEKIGVGDNVRIRGRDFLVKGVFKTGTYQDNEVWISLTDAQKLLNYGEDVSIYIIPDGGTFHEGQVIADGISISRKGETNSMLGREISSYYNYLGLIAIFACIATIFTQANFLWRIAWLHHHEFGIIRAFGFGKSALFIYLFVQGLCIVAVGFCAGIILAAIVMFVGVQQLSIFGWVLAPTLNFETISIALGVSIFILVSGIAFPVFRIIRLNIPKLMAKD